MEKHQNFMNRAFEIAAQMQGTVRQNPMVGCVIVHDNSIIGEGRHEFYGGPHAEVNAINNIPEDKRHLLAKSSLYVTLEPCFHHGNTPPCVNQLLKHNIPDIYVSCLDPNPKVAGKSIQKLKENNHQVTVGILENQGKELIRRYLTFTEKKRPYVILKFAQSKDGYIGKQDEFVWLTNPISKRLSHKWRSKESSILVGTNTVATDNPQLNTRLWEGSNPVRIILDQHLRLNQASKVFDQSIKTIVFHNANTIPQDQENLFYKQVNFNERLIEQLLEELYHQKLKSVIIEGGAKTLNTFIQVNLWDEARVFTAPQQLMDGIKAPEFNGTAISTLEIQEDLLTIYRNFKAS